MTRSSWSRKLLPLFLALAALLPTAASAAEPPDPLDRGSYTVNRLDPFKAGLATLHEPNASGGAPTGGNSAITLQIRGVMYTPDSYDGRSPVIVLVHGNHGSCDSGQAPNCTIFKRNDSGYAYLGENLASWGYAVFSLDQDQMMSRQDGFARGMHSRRLLIAALLDALYEANENGLPLSEDSNLGDSLKGKLDMTRIGLMGHSRGGDAVTSFIDYNRMRPEGRRYPLRGVISLAQVDYERRAPYGTPYMSILPTCDGDVSNLQGARTYERSQYAQDDPYPRIQSTQIGGNHNWYNTVWEADGEDGGNVADEACQIVAANSLRMSGEAGPGPAESYSIDNSDKLNPLVNTRISGDPARMGDQEKVGLATMSAFFRRYVGGEGAFEPYLTGELAAEGKPQLPPSACPASTTGTRISCLDRVATSYFAPPEERLDVIRPEAEMPLEMSALGTELTAAGFSNPYLKGGGVSPKPATTATGLDWCNPDPKQSEPVPLGEGGYPTAVKPCPLPAPNAVGGQEGVREQGPVNQSYGRQLSVAWEGPASLATTIPAASSDVSGFEVLTLASAVNFFDGRNPARSTWDPQVGMQDFTIALIDGAGKEATVSAGDPRYGIALQQSHGSVSSRVHVILKDIRVPLADFAGQGLDLGDVRKLELRFGEDGKPASGSVQLADVRFQEAVGGTDVLLDSTAPDAGPGEGPPASGPDPMDEIEAFDRSTEGLALPTVTSNPGASVWTVDDERDDCPNARFTSIQDAVDQASAWDTIVICPGLYEESSVPVNAGPSPAQEGSKNGLTIKKPLKIVGAGADKVTIRPAASLGQTLAGTEPFLRDGGGNVITISRQSMGSSEFTENFVDISGVRVESPFAYAEAGIAFFNTSGRVSDSVVGPLRTATSNGQLTSRPHGWGIIATNSMIGDGPGTILRQVTVVDSVVGGYQTGGILFDNASGKDAAEAAKQPSKILLKGVVTGSAIEGRGVPAAGFVFPQTGIQYHAGASGFVEDSRIADNLFAADQRKSAGLLLTGAETGQWHVKGSLLSGNGYGLFNADVTNTDVRGAAPALATGNFWGTNGTPIVGKSVLGPPFEEGVSEDDKEAVPAPSVTFTPVASEAPGVSAPGAVPDLLPSGSIVNPGDGAGAEAGVPTEVVVAADDDYGVKTVTLTADGEPVAELTEAPYIFAWVPGEEEQGETVELEATIIDSGDQATTSTIDVPVKEAEAPPKPPTADPGPPTPPSPPKFTVEKVKRLAGKGLAMLKVQVPGAGKLVASGPKVKRVTLNPKAASDVWVTVQAKGNALATLTEEGTVTVRVQLAFTGGDGQSFIRTRSVVLMKK